jgi:hypothetical protein
MSHPVERPVAHDEEACRNEVAAVRADLPSAAVAVPLNARDLCGQARAAVEVEVRRDPVTVLEDLWGMHVLLGGDVPRLLEQGQIDIRLDIALRPGVTVPVPGSAEVTTFLNDAKVAHAPFDEARRRDEPCEPTADDGDGDVLVERLPIHGGHVGVVEVVGERPGYFDVLRVAVGPDPLVPLEPVLLSQGFGIEVRHGCGCGSLVDAHAFRYVRGVFTSRVRS